MSKKCFIIGCLENELNFAENSTACDDFKDKVEGKLTEMIENGDADVFSTCMRLGADTYAAETVLRLRDRYPHISLECVIPFEEQAADFAENERDRYFSIFEQCDREVLFSTAFNTGCVERCIDSLKESADLLLFAGTDAPQNADKPVFYISA